MNLNLICLRVEEIESNMFKIALLIPILALSYASLASAQRFAPGYCPTVAAHEGFDKTKVGVPPPRATGGVSLVGNCVL